jgi:hypothetical protein
LMPWRDLGTTRGADGVCCEYNNGDMRCVLAPHVWHDCGLVLGRIWSVFAISTGGTLIARSDGSAILCNAWRSPGALRSALHRLVVRVATGTVVGGDPRLPRPRLGRKTSEFSESRKPERPETVAQGARARGGLERRVWSVCATSRASF